MKTLREAAQELVSNYRFFGCNWDLVEQLRTALESDEAFAERDALRESLSVATERIAQLTAELGGQK